MSAQFDIDRFEQTRDLVAQLVRAEDAFSIMRRRIGLPPTCAALVWSRAGQPRLSQPGSSIVADGVQELLVARTTVVELHYTADGLRSQDGYDFSAQDTYGARCRIPHRWQHHIIFFEKGRYYSLLKEVG